MRYDAYWISPSGKIVPVEDGAVAHINMVWRKPEFFGYTKAEIEKLHQRHGERIGQEGKAREEIMRDLLQKGWVRIRYVPKQMQFTLQTGTVKPRRVKDLIWDWADMVTKGELDKLDPKSYYVFISTTKPEETRTLSLKEILSAGLEESRRTPRAEVVHLS